MTLDQACALLDSAEHPEDVFVVNGDPVADIKRQFRELAKITHTDKTGSNPRAEAAFKRLNELHELAQDKLKKGTFGDRNVMDVVVKTRTVEYHLTRRLEPGDLTNVYAGTVKGKTEPLLFKVSRDPVNNDLVLAERDILTGIQKSDPVPAEELVGHHLPKLVDSFEITQGKDKQRVNVFERFDADYRSLAEIIAAYPDGIDMRDAAWMFRRLLGALCALHANGVVHGGVVPSHFFVALKPKEQKGAHNGILVDYCGAVKRGKPLKVLVDKYQGYYPNDVYDKTPVDSGLDLHMAGECLEALVGGFMKLPAQIQAIVRACQLRPRHRLKDPFEVHEDFSNALKVLYGPSRFRNFKMP